MGATGKVRSTCGGVRTVPAREEGRVIDAFGKAYGQR
jgi:hypothetical protein